MHKLLGETYMTFKSSLKHCYGILIIAGITATLISCGEVSKEEYDRVYQNLNETSNGLAISEIKAADLTKELDDIQTKLDNAESKLTAYSKIEVDLADLRHRTSQSKLLLDIWHGLVEYGITENDAILFDLLPKIGQIEDPEIMGGFEYLIAYSDTISDDEALQIGLSLTIKAGEYLQE